MSKLSVDETKHAALLAKLNLSDIEIEKFTKQLSSVIDHMANIREVDTKDTEPTAQTTGLLDVFGSDEIKPERYLTQDEAVSGTENIKNGFFVVSQIIKKDD